MSCLLKMLFEGELVGGDFVEDVCFIKEYKIVIL